MEGRYPETASRQDYRDTLVLWIQSAPQEELTFIHQIDYGLVYNNIKGNEMKIRMELSQKDILGACGMQNKLGKQSKQYLPQLHVQSNTAVKE